MPESNVDTEFDGRRDHLGRFIQPHIPTADEELRVLHSGDSRKASVRRDRFEGNEPLPTNLRKPRFATPKWEGSYIPDED